MKHGTSIALLVLVAGCGEKAKAPEGGGLGSSVPEQGSAAPDPVASGKAVVPTLDESVEYVDGETTRKLWLSKDLVAEFNPSENGKTVVLATDPSAKEVPQPQPIVRIWRLSGALRGEAFATAVRTPALIVSPVVHEGPSEALPMRALPGGVVATFKPDWDRARIDAWLALKSLSIQGDPVVGEANVYLVGTAPGLSALLVAQELRKGGELVDAVPNFWRQNTPK
jgi:hypothetical protein